MLRVFKAKVGNRIPGAAWSWDRSHVHDHLQLSAVWPDNATHPVARHPLAHYSPDMHKVIEHVFGYIKPAFHQEVYKLGMSKNLTSTSAQELLRRVCHQKITAAGVAADCASLLDTLYIIAGDKGTMHTTRAGQQVECVAGGWPEKRYR